MKERSSRDDKKRENDHKQLSMLYSRQSTKSIMKQTSKARSTRPVRKNRGFIKKLFAARRPNEARSTQMESKEKENRNNLEIGGHESSCIIRRKKGEKTIQ